MSASPAASKEVTELIKWQRFAKTFLVLGTLAALLVASGAGTRWH
jgi:hypothetical protein